MSKSLVQQIRELVEISTESNQYPPVHADAILGHLCVSKSDERELFTIIADRIESEYMELPTLEGEPLRVGDKVDGYNQEGAEVVAVMNSRMVVVGYPLMLWCVDDLKRYRQEVLDTDGVPINVGDVVYFVDNAEPFDVLRIEHEGDEPIHIGREDRTSTDAWVSPGDLTHKQPDTLERIEEDARKLSIEYWGCEGISCDECPASIDGKIPSRRYENCSNCIEAITLDLLRRQRELLERGQA